MQEPRAQTRGGGALDLRQFPNPFATGDVGGVASGPRGLREIRTPSAGGGGGGDGSAGAAAASASADASAAKMRWRAASYRACRSASVAFVGAGGGLAGPEVEAPAEGRFRMRRAGWLSMAVADAGTGALADGVGAATICGIGALEFLGVGVV